VTARAPATSNQCNNGAGNFLVRAGITDNRVASLKLFLPNGVTEDVKLQDDVYALQAPGSIPVKLVAYDAQGRVVGIRVL
jgi:hypothetical protein